MSVYYPDKWVIVEIIFDNKPPLYKVLASWYGGYLGSNSWKLSSGNEKILDEGKIYRIPQSSGSVYCCSKEVYGMSMYTASVFSDFEDQLKNKPGASIRILTEEEISKFVL